MKNTTKMTLIVVLLTLALSGCGGVWLNAEYSDLLDRTAALSTETSDRASAGELTEAEMAAALKAQAKVWGLFQVARDGLSE